MKIKSAFLFLGLCLSLSGCGQVPVSAVGPLSIKSLAEAGASSRHVHQATSPVGKPVFRWVSDATGLPATKILVMGEHFSGTTRVILNGHRVPFSVGSDKQLFLIVAPETVATSLSVTNAAGTTSVSRTENSEAHP